MYRCALCALYPEFGKSGILVNHSSISVTMVVGGWLPIQLCLQAVIVMIHSSVVDWDSSIGKTTTTPVGIKLIVLYDIRTNGVVYVPLISIDIVPCWFNLSI